MRRVVRLVAAMLIAAGLLAGSVFFFSRGSLDPESQLVAAEQAFALGDYAAAERFARDVLDQFPDSTQARLLAGHCAVLRGDLDTAWRDLAGLPDEPSPDVIAGIFEAAALSRQAGRASVCELLLRRVLHLDPQFTQAHSSLAYLLGVEGRCFEATPHLIEAVRRHQFSVHHLVLLGASDPVIKDDALVDLCQQTVPDDPLPLIGIARSAFRNDDRSQARRLLEKVVSLAPECSEAQGQLGRVLQAESDFSGNDAQVFADWNLNLPPQAEEHPEVWTARGLRAQALGDHSGATRCLWEALKRNPNHRLACFQLGQALVAQGDAVTAEPFLKRAEELQQLALLVDQVYRSPDDPTLLRQAAERCWILGRDIEALGWVQMAASQDGRQAWDVQLEQQIRKRQPLIEAQAMAVDPSRQVDFTQIPLPSFKPPDRASETKESPGNPLVVTFRDDAATAGIDFVYRTRGPHDDGDLRMLETTGGGVAVIDADGDWFPDLYFSQGGTLPEPGSPGNSATLSTTQPQQQVDRNTIGAESSSGRLFRQQGDGTFQDITSTAGLNTSCYGQGVSVGDLNNDGFPDLYVASFGSNTLFQNNGDGTFSDITADSGLAGQEWTTSCLIADLNGDSWPDLYDVNYLSYGDASRATCRRGDELQWCSPDAFAAAQDRLFLSHGDGTFHDATEDSGLAVADGKGLGIVAADFTGTGLLSLFIANDAVANGYFINQTSSRGNTPVFQESAATFGLALDDAGLAQACMGVAAGDANGDGRVDLFVTNFFEQSNTLYLQQPLGHFVDTTRRSGLRDASYRQLGFGTQFLDGDRDGRPDLVVTNGHVLDLSRQGVPYEMPPQYFRNRGDGRFEELPAAMLGPFFEQRLLGRAMARLDWNRDGRDDFAVSHINASASLVTNVSPSPGNFLSVRLVSVTGDRDAFGSAVTVASGNAEWTQQLTAGDGYQASNERRLLFGLGNAEHVDILTIRWPSGRTETWNDLPANTDVIFRESSSAMPAIVGNWNGSGTRPK